MNNTPQPATTLQLTKPLTHDEAATVLAALRIFQSIRAGHTQLYKLTANDWPPHTITAATMADDLEHFEDARPLDVTELETLCEAINLQPIAPAAVPVVVLLEGGLVEEVYNLPAGTSYDVLDVDGLRDSDTPGEEWRNLGDELRRILQEYAPAFAERLRTAAADMYDCHDCPKEVTCDGCGNATHQHHCAHCTVPLCDACAQMRDNEPYCPGCSAWK